LHTFYRTGAFRVAFLSSPGKKNLEDSSYNNSTRIAVGQDSTVLKTLKFKLDFNYESYEYIRMDALVSEKLSWSSRIVDIFGFCGLAMMTEAMMHGDLMDLAVPKGGHLKEPMLDKEKLQDHSPFSPDKKLELALDMVEAVAVLHSYPGGVIVHDDIQLPQVRHCVHKQFPICFVHHFVCLAVSFHSERLAETPRLQSSRNNAV
jgi:serine/threonine protein kinase